MTDEAKALTWLRGAFDTDSVPEKNLAIRKAHDLIETQAREIERLRTALENVLAHRYGNWCNIARAALGDSHDQ